MALKFHLVAYAALLIASLWNYGQWQKTKVELVAQQNKVSALEDANQQQKVTIRQTNELSLASQGNVATLIETTQDLNGQYNEARSEVTQLRTTASVKANEKPFEWGNSVTDRRKRFLVPTIPASH